MKYQNSKSTYAEENIYCGEQKIQNLWRSKGYVKLNCFAVKH